MSRLASLVLVGAACAALSLSVLSVPAAYASGVSLPAAPPTPRGLPSAIEPLATYVAQVSCDQRTQPGTAKLAALLRSTYANTTTGTIRACGNDGASEHYDGRAIDWMVDVHNHKQYTDAKAVLNWLLGADHAGNSYAIARRLGVMYVIYNNRMWGAWDGKWEEYNGCSHLTSSANDNACHRTHMHISLDWNGAMGRTSFWTKSLSPTDYGPCRSDGMNWAYLYRRANLEGCSGASRPTVAKGASSLKRTLVSYAGASVRRGWSGPAVSAVQQALHVPSTGYYNKATERAVYHFQVVHHLRYRSGAMNIRTWRALLEAVR